MNKPLPNTLNEALRLKALYAYDVLGEGLHEELYNLAKLATQITNSTAACIAFIDKENILNKVSYGVQVDEYVFPRSGTISQYFIESNQPYILLGGISQRPEFAVSPIVKFVPEADFCACFPIRSEGGFLIGFFFVIDNKPNLLSEVQLDSLQTLLAQIHTHLELRLKNLTLKDYIEKKEEFVNIFEASPEVHCILNRKGEILFINSAAKKVLGYNPSSTFGKSIWPYFHKDDINRVAQLLIDGLKSGQKQFSIDFRVVSATANVKWLSWNAVAKGDRWYAYGRDITEKKELDSKLTNLSFVASRVNNAVVISDASNRVGWVNDAFTKITGYSLKDVQGHPLGDLLSGPGTDWSVIEAARLAMSKKESFEVELLGYRKDGEKVWLSIHSSIILSNDGEIETEIEIIIDITERKKVEQELEVLSAVASKTSTAVVMYDKDWKITWVNEACETLMGYSKIELLGQYPHEVFLEKNEDKEKSSTLKKMAATNSSAPIEILAKRKDGVRIWVSVVNTPIYNSKTGEVERYVELISDISTRKQFEDDIIKAKEQAQQLGEAKEMFLSVMSHEMRTPLNAVIGMTHLLLESNPKPSQVEDLNILKFSGENLLRIINDVLDFSKIETGNLVLESIPVDLAQLCNDIISLLQIEAQKRNNKLTLYFDRNIPKELLSDKTRLYQILMNLLGNALKFTDNGHVDLWVDVTKQDEQSVDILFQIKDTGIGIPKEKQNYIFESFTQAGADISRKYGGTGLGLAITKRLVKLFGAEIQLESVEGKGSNFHFTIRMNRANEHQPHNKATETNFNNKRILIVDDNQINILVAQRILTKWGLNIDHVTDGYQAIEMIAKNKYDLVLMDIHMPGIDGYETTTIIRGMDDDYHRNLPIIALTASTLSDHVHRFEAAGMNGYAFKPFNPAEIKKILQSFFN
jgi:PAS domain S-box-containing protein